MTPKSFWLLFIKILGIWLVIDSLSVISDSLSLLPYLHEADAMRETIIFIIISFGIYYLTLWSFLFKTEWIIEKLKLDKSFSEEKFELNIKYETVLSIATIVIGGLMFIDSLPLLIKEIFSQNKENIVGNEGSMNWILFYLGKTFIGYLLVTNHQVISNILAKRINKNDNDGLKNELSQTRID